MVHDLDQLAVMFFTFYVISTVILLQVFGLPITFITEHTPQTGREGTVVLTWEPQDADCFHLFSFEPRVTSGIGRSAESLVAARKPPVSFGVAGLHYIDTLCGESVVLHATSPHVHVLNEGIRPNKVLAQSATSEMFGNLAHRDLHEDSSEDLTVRAHNGGAIKFRIVRDGGNATSGDATTNSGHGSTAISKDATIGQGGTATGGNATTSGEVCGTPNSVVINGNGGSSISTSGIEVGNGNPTSEDVIGANGGNTTNGDANGGNVTVGSTTSGGGDIIGGNGGNTASGDANGGNVNVGDAISDSATSTSAVQAASASSTSPTTDTSRHRTNAPVIIGIIIGSVALAVTLGILWRRRKRRLGEDNAVTPKDESLRTDFRPSTHTISNPFTPNRRRSDVPSPSDSVFPEPRMVPPSRSSYLRPREGGQSLEDEILRTEAVGTTYGESPPPSWGGMKSRIGNLEMRSRFSNPYSASLRNSFPGKGEMNNGCLGKLTEDVEWGIPKERIAIDEDDSVMTSSLLSCIVRTRILGSSPGERRGIRERTSVEVHKLDSLGCKVYHPMEDSWMRGVNT
ncbi:uncharacterized protein ARMOST_20714 [Armillaria ostoyae]|uniref:Uncharacterized protein n=1 Tax=Armillaria ostoyae TaxID=47428 RepID=A0A284S879_ARMOS|nr:uncharacterized protein ARMOST_20714 [Armillaria ostoyae]